MEEAEEIINSRINSLKGYIKRLENETKKMNQEVEDLNKEIGSNESRIKEYKNEAEDLKIKMDIDIPGYEYRYIDRIVERKQLINKTKFKNQQLRDKIICIEEEIQKNKKRIQEASQKLNQYRK